MNVGKTQFQHKLLKERIFRNLLGGIQFRKLLVPIGFSWRLLLQLSIFLSNFSSCEGTFIPCVMLRFDWIRNSIHFPVIDLLNVFKIDRFLLSFSSYSIFRIRISSVYSSYFRFRNRKCHLLCKQQSNSTFIVPKIFYNNRHIEFYFLSHSYYIILTLQRLSNILDYSAISLGRSRTLTLIQRHRSAAIILRIE